MVRTGSPPFTSHLGHLEAEQPYLGDDPPTNWDDPPRIPCWEQTYHIPPESENHLPDAPCKGDIVSFLEGIYLFFSQKHQKVSQKERYTQQCVEKTTWPFPSNQLHFFKNTSLVGFFRYHLPSHSPCPSSEVTELESQHLEGSQSNRGSHPHLPIRPTQSRPAKSRSIRQVLFDFCCFFFRRPGKSLIFCWGCICQLFLVPGKNKLLFC